MSGAKLLFYDLRGEDAKIQVMANAKYVLLLACLFVCFLGVLLIIIMMMMLQ